MDYQWPSLLLRPGPYVPGMNHSRNLEKIKAIEGFFREKFQTDAVLLPSGRAAIALLLRHFQIGRGQTVFTTKWSSHCLFNAIGAFANVNTTLAEPADALIINHKWGRPVRLERNHGRALLIEDSVDSIHLGPESLFPNGGKFEIVSLPKVIGSYSGSIVFTKDPAFAQYARSLQQEGMVLAAGQSLQKCLAARQELDTPATWPYLESWNTALDANALEDIALNLPNYDNNKEVIRNRYTRAEDALGATFIPKGRLGPVIPLDKEKFPARENSGLMSRQFSFSPWLESPLYVPVHVLPLHFGVPEEHFDKLLKELSP